MRQYLKEHPADHNIRDAAAFIGRSTGFACKLPAWMARPPKTGDEVQQHRSNRRERELTDAILANVGVEADPSENACLREAAWLYAERKAKNDDELRRLRNMTDAEREVVIVSVIETFDKDIPES
jgi:hypothetical protein